jgi:hypothetical protein
VGKCKGTKTSVTFSGERAISEFENRVLKRIFGFKRDEFKRSGEKYIMRSLIMCTAHTYCSGVNIEKRWSGHIARMGRGEGF